MIRPYQKGDPVKVDETTKRLLGVTDEAQIKVVEGQSADKKKLQASQGQYLLAEACVFGDAMVK